MKLGLYYELSDEQEIKIENSCNKQTKAETFEVEIYKLKGVFYSFNKTNVVCLFI